MKRLAMVITLAAACSGAGKKTASPGDGSGSGSAIYAKKLTVSWGIQQSDASADVFLQTTDDKGAQVSYPLGTYDGHCKIITPVPDMNAPTGVACVPDAGGATVELDAVLKPDEVVVLKGTTQPGATPDPMAREEVTRIKAPGGAAVSVGA